MVRDLSELYRSEVAGGEPCLPALPVAPVTKTFIASLRFHSYFGGQCQAKGELARHGMAESLVCLSKRLAPVDD